MMFFTSTLFLYALTLVSYVAAIPATPTFKDTNASRLSRGLPPLRPRSLLHSSLTKKRNAAPSPSPSSIAHVDTSALIKNIASAPSESWSTGRIQVRNTAGLVMGYVENPGASASNIGINYESSKDDAHFGLHIPSSSNSLLDLVIITPNLNGPTYLGARSSSLYTTHLASGSADSVDLLNVAQTKASSIPVLIPHTTDLGESAIWTFDTLTKQLTPHYINPNGNQAPTTIGYRTKENQLFFVGDVDAWAKANSGYEAVPVTFHFEQD
jgi:hypothetical protein